MLQAGVALGRALDVPWTCHVEPDRDGFWWADMGPSGGPVLGPFRSRSEALAAEMGWLLGQGRFARRSPLPDQDCKIVYNRAVQLE